MSGEQVLEFVAEAQKSGGKISPYLKTETLDPSPVFEEPFLRVYGSNFYDLVEKDGGFTTPDRPKALLLLFLWPNCLRCQHIEAYLERYAFEPHNSNRLKRLQFATFDLDFNTPSPWYLEKLR